MPDARLHVIIVTHNAEKHLDFCLPPLAALPGGWKTVVVDNASRDNTRALIRERYPWAELLENRENLGFGRANNVALRKALCENADHVFLLNQDARMEAADLAGLVDLQRHHPEFVLLSPIHLNGPGSEIDLSFAGACAPGNCPGLYLDGLRGRLREVYPTRKCNAAAWLLSRGCLRAVGGFNPVFFHYGEDDDYMNRLRFHGCLAGVTPLFFVRHARPQRRAVRRPDSFFIRSLVKFVDPARQPPSVLRLLARFAPALVRNLLRGRGAVARHYGGVLRDLLRARLFPARWPGPDAGGGIARRDP